MNVLMKGFIMLRRYNFYIKYFGVKTVLAHFIYFCLEIVHDLAGKMVNYAGNFVYEIPFPFTCWFKLKALTQTELWRN